MPNRGTLISLSLHVLAMVGMFFAGYSIPPLVEKHKATTGVIRLIPRVVTAPPSGGGDRSRNSSRKGRPPARPLRRVFAPAIPRADEPKLPLQLAMLEAPDLSDTAPIGDPFNSLRKGFSGRDGLLGIGQATGPGIGPEDGRRLGGVLEFRPAVRPPQVLYHPEPEYSEEARKVRFQGSVLLSIVVDVDGRPSQIHVVRGAGLGLDEKAVEAVRTWRFRPAVSVDGPVPAPALALVEVAFHLL